MDTYRKPRLKIAAMVNLSFLSIWRFQRMTNGRIEHEKSVTIEDTVVYTSKCQFLIPNSMITV